MASNPPGKCCTVGVKHEGEATGEIKLIGDIEAYFAYPKDKSTEKALLIITDVIGHKFINAQLVADQFAANGYFVVMPDLFHGDPVLLNGPPGFDLMAWLKGHGTERVDPVIEASLKEIKAQGAKKIGGVGYCFGGKYVARFLKKGQLDVGYTAHPSFMSEEELRAIEGPLSISAAETDTIFPENLRHKTEQILKEELSVPYQVSLYSGCEHGFAVRADLSNKEAKFAKEQAFIQAVQWFDYYL